MNLDAYEKDCEQACYRFLEEKKQEIREGHTAATEIWIETPPLSSYLHYRYIPNNSYEDQQGYLIMKSWQARASSELSDFWEDYKRNRRTQQQRAEREKEEKRRREEEIRRQEEEEERREEEEERRREEERERRREEERRRAEAKRQEQDKKNRETLSKIQAEWKANHSSQKPAFQPQQASDSLFCCSCGAPNAKTAKFCTKCGTQMQLACPSCGQLVRVGSKFCTMCGTRLSENNVQQ